MGDGLMMCGLAEERCGVTMETRDVAMGTGTSSYWQPASRVSGAT